MINVPRNVLLFGLPIQLEHELGTIYQPIIKDFNSFDLNKLVRSFNIKKETFFDIGKVPEGLKDFDLFFIESLSFLLEDLLKSLSLLYKCKLEDMKLTVIEGYPVLTTSDKKFVLHRENYAYLCKIISIMLDIEYVETDEKGEMTEIEKIIAERRAKWEREHPKKEEDGYSIYDLIDYVLHADGTTYTYDSIQELTIYQVKNTSKLYSKKESYKLFMEYKTSGQFNIEEEKPHWFFDKK